MNTRYSKNLPQDLYLFYIFNQLTVKEVSNAKSVSKEWYTMGEKFFKKTKNQEFFMVGNNIIPFAFKPLCNTYILPYDCIDAEVIKDSFPKKGFVKLFKSEKECKAYARFLRAETDNNEIAEPAVFKVKFIGKIPISLIKASILIKKMRISYFLAPKLPPKTEIEYFEANVKQLIPLTVYLDIDKYDSGSSKNYGVLDFQNKCKKLIK